MYEKELKRVKKIILQMVRRKRFVNKKVYVFGVSDNTRQIIQILREQDISVQNVIDNDKTKQNGYCACIKVISLAELKNINGDKNVFLIYSAYWREMVGQLKQLNVKKNSIKILFQTKRSLIRLIYDTYYGRYIYRKIMCLYGNVPMFICPYTGTGDIYLIGTFWKQYIEKNNIEGYVFVVITGACKKVAELCNIENVYLVKDKREVPAMLSYYRLCPNKVNIKVLNDCWGEIHTNQIEWFRGYKELYFTRLFREYVFDLGKDSRPLHPTLKDRLNEVIEIVEQNHLQKGKTVIISPYSNTLSDLPMVFWENLTEYLLAQGYIVCTNSSGATEPAIKGSIPIFFPLNIAPQLIEWAGVFIGVRSGFCDIISNAKAQKIILYDKRNRFYMGSAYEYFNLKDMGLTDDAIEIQYDEDIDGLYEMVKEKVRWGVNRDTQI